jgi:putative FmdB family regulatory protein
LHGDEVRGLPPWVTAAAGPILPSPPSYPFPMPLYDFRCRACGTEFEELVRGNQSPACPACGATDPERLLSSVSPLRKFGLRGPEARRSNALRRVREERRREERAARRARRDQG